MPLLPIPPNPPLLPTGVAAGTYSNAGITVNALGQLSYATSGFSGVGSSPASGGLALPHSHISKKVVVTSNTAAIITAAYLTAVNASGATIALSGVNITVATGTSGVGGLDTGSLAASTWYYLYAIYNGTTVSSLMSLQSPFSVTAPTLPSGYTYWAYAGPVRTDSSKNLYRTLQSKSRVTYVYTAGTNTAQLPVFAGSSIPVGNVSTPLWAAVSVSPFVAPTAGVAYIQVFGSTNTASGIIVAPNNASTWGYSASQSPQVYFIYLNTSDPINTLDVSIPLETTNIYWASNVAGWSQLSARGYEESL